MKTRTKIIIALSVACAGTLVLASCGSDKYDELAKRDFTVSVRFDTNGGSLFGAEQDRETIVDTYRLSDVQREDGVLLLSPEDPRRATAGKINVTRTGYHLAGWYQTREPREENGVPLDEDGNPCTLSVPHRDEAGNEVIGDDGQPVMELVSESGKPQGYTYSGKWDFEKDRFHLDDYVYESGKVAKTLYAAWIPDYTYELLGQVQTTENGNTETTWEVFASYRVEVYGEGGQPSEADKTIALPAWDETGALDYHQLKLQSSIQKTFLEAFSDKEMAQKATSFVCDPEYDEETGTVKGSLSRYYATWEDGLWYHLSSAKQLADAARDRGGAITNYSFELYGDLDFSAEGVSWPETFTTAVYNGTFRSAAGSRHKIANADVVQKMPSSGKADATTGGLFGALGAEAALLNVSFENITYRLEIASMVESYFGLLAGSMETETKIENVTVTGTLAIGSGIYTPLPKFDPVTGAPIIERKYSVGLLTGNLVTNGIAIGDIELELAEGVYAEADGSGRVTIL